MWDSIMVALATFLPFLDGDVAGEAGRRAALERLLDQAVMLHRTEPRRIETDYVRADPKSDPDYQLNLEMAELELASGYFAATCVYDPHQVWGMRYMIAYVEVMRMLGTPDENIARDIVEHAGEDGDRVRRLVEYVGLGNIGHVICLDYMRERLSQGIDASLLREYIRHIPTNASAVDGDYSAGSRAAAPTDPSGRLVKPSKS